MVTASNREQSSYTPFLTFDLFARVCVCVCVAATRGGGQALTARPPSTQSKKRSLEGKEKSSRGSWIFFKWIKIRHFLA